MDWMIYWVHYWSQYLLPAVVSQTEKFLIADQSVLISFWHAELLS